MVYENIDVTEWTEEIKHKTKTFIMHLYDDEEIEINDELKERIAQAVKEKILKDFDDVVHIGKFTEPYTNSNGNDSVTYDMMIVI